MKYDIEKIKGVISASIYAQLIFFDEKYVGKKTTELRDSFAYSYEGYRDKDKEQNKSIIRDVLFSSLKEDCDVDFDHPENVVYFFKYLYENNLGLYLLLKTLSHDLLMTGPEDWDYTKFSEEEFGMSENDDGVLIRGINTILFLFEFVYRFEGEHGMITLYVWELCEAILKNTFEVIVKINGILSIDDPEFALCLEGFALENKGWAFYLERIQEILNENETLDQNVKYFEPWWNGKS